MLLGSTINEQNPFCPAETFGETFCRNEDYLEDRKRVYWVGGLIAAVGVAEMLIPGRTERAWQAVNQLEDPLAREHFAFNQLSVLSDKARFTRLTNGVLSAGLGLYLLAEINDPENTTARKNEASLSTNTTSDNTNLYTALFLGVSTLSHFFIQSPEEKAFASVKNGAASKLSYDLNVSPDLDDVSVTARYHF